MIILEHGPAPISALTLTPNNQATQNAVLFDDPIDTFIAWSSDEVRLALAQADAARAKGAWVAGAISYEAGYALEPKLRHLMAKKSAEQAEPLVCLAAFSGPQSAKELLDDAQMLAKDVQISQLENLISFQDYSQQFNVLKDYINQGDCYQVNLTFPMKTALLSGNALGLYGALRERQPVGYGAFVDFGVDPIILSRSPELFFRIKSEDVRGAIIESQPMKGTAPRSEDPIEDMALAFGLRSGEKTQAENLMIVDLLRNDIGRIAKTGTVRVPELFKVESFSTLHQMSSRIEGVLKSGSGVLELMEALFPCGSINGAPKIRAMEIIHEIEPFSRGGYCGAIGWAAPDDRQCWNVSIRTMRLWGNNSIVMNVGGGIVYDSTAVSEWDEALWKARYVAGLVR